MRDADAGLREAGESRRRRSGCSARTRRRRRASRARRGTRPAGSRRVSLAVLLLVEPSRQGACAGRARALRASSADSRMQAARDRERASRARPRSARGRRPGARRAARCRRGRRRSSSTSESGGRPPCDAPRSIEPREATMRTPSSRAARTSASIRPGASAREDVVVVEDGRAAGERELGEPGPGGGVLGLLVDARPDRDRAPSATRTASPSCARARVSVWYRWWCVLTRPGVDDRAAEVDGRFVRLGRVAGSRPPRSGRRGRAASRRRARFRRRPS